MDCHDTSPGFCKKGDFEWAVKEASAKKKMDFSKVEFFTYEEGICVQCMHTGSYDSEMETIQKMKKYASDQGMNQITPTVSIMKFT